MARSKTSIPITSMRFVRVFCVKFMFLFQARFFSPDLPSFYWDFAPSLFHLCTVPQQSLVLFVPNRKIFLGIKIFRHGCWLVSVSESSLRHRIISSRAKGLTPKDTPNRQDQSDHSASFPKRLQRVRRAGRRKTAGRSSLERRKHLFIKEDQPNKRIFHVLSARNISSLAKMRRRSRSTSVDLASKIPCLGATTTKNPVFSSGSTAR